MNIPELFLIQVIVNGLTPALKTIIMPQGPTTLEDLAHQLRIAEATIRATKHPLSNISSLGSE